MTGRINFNRRQKVTSTAPYIIYSVVYLQCSTSSTVSYIDYSVLHHLQCPTSSTVSYIIYGALHHLQCPTSSTSVGLQRFLEYFSFPMNVQIGDFNSAIIVIILLIDYAFILLKLQRVTAAPVQFHACSAISATLCCSATIPEYNLCGRQRPQKGGCGLLLCNCAEYKHCQQLLAYLLVTFIVFNRLMSPQSATLL